MTEPNGFYYMRARYYDPKVGRFISEDPIGFEGGDVNLMVYVTNNPVNRIDPLGLFWPFGPGLINIRSTPDPYAPTPDDIPMDPNVQRMFSPGSRGRAIPGQFGTIGIYGGYEAGKLIWQGVIDPVRKAFQYGTPIPVVPNRNILSPPPAEASPGKP